MTYDLVIIMGFSVFIAVLLSFIKFSRIGKIYYPFIFVIWLAALNELISYILINNGHFNIINSNIYSLLEALLLIWFFDKLGNFRKNRFMPFMFALSFIMAWFIDNFVINQFGTAFTSWFIIIYSFPIVLWSINTINGLLFREKELLKHPTFLICVGFIIFFTYRIVVEVFWMYGLMAKGELGRQVYHILSIINLLCNLIYALAILWMQKKQAFSLQF